MNTKCWPLELALTLSKILPRGKGAIPRIIGRIFSPFIHHNFTTRHGASLPIVPGSLDVFVAMRQECNSWDYWVFRAMNELTSKHGVVFDIGANVGYLSTELAFLREKEGVIVYAFEPQKNLAVNIKKAKEINGLENLIPYEVALSDTESEAFFGIRSHSVHGSIDVGVESHNKVNSRIRLQTRTLDAMLLQGEVEPPNLMKLDVEGYELPILKGAADLISKFQPVIIFEVSLATFEFGYSPQDCSEFLRGLGDYSFYNIKGEALKMDQLRFDESQHYDILAIPEDQTASLKRYRNLFTSDHAPR